MGLGAGHAQQFKEFTIKCSDGVERPYVIYDRDQGAGNREQGTGSKSEKRAARGEKKPLLVFLHGAVSAPAVKADPVGYAKKWPLIALADKGDFYVLFPFGQKGAEWFDSVWQQMVLSEIETVKEQYPIDEDRVFISGFSDGGSGVYCFAMQHPEPFAGFIAMNGSVKVANMLSKAGLYPENTNGRPLYIINTKGDVLYPLDQMQASAEILKKYNPNVTFRALEGAHDMSYLPAESEGLLSFIKNNKRALPTKFSWETDDVSNSGFAWLKVIQLDTLAEAKDWQQPYKDKVMNNKADFGVKYDYMYKGKGLRVAGFKNDTVTARKMGIEKGDVLLKMEQDSLTSPFVPMYYAAKKKAGEPTTLTFERAGKVQTVSGHFNAGYPYYLIKNKHRSGKVEAEIRGKTLYVKTSRVKAYEVDKKYLKKLGAKKVVDDE